MIIDRPHGRWILATAALAVSAALLYLWADRSEPGGVRGGSAVGLVFGIAAAGVILFETLLALKKRFPAWRLGRATRWMRGHIWLGLLAVPLALFHSGFRSGGAMSTLLLVLLGLVTVSGLFGLALQQILPRLMTARVEMETVYEQIPAVVAQLAEEAARKVEEAANPLLTDFFREEMRRFLDDASRGRHRLSDPGRAEALFRQLRTRLPGTVHETVADLENICEERRQLATQERLHLWLHGWLLLHVPISYALILLVGAHAVMTLLFR